MARQIHCDGCGKTEPIDATEHEIKTVNFIVGPRTDIRWATEKTEEEKHEADLCPTCIGMLLHNYFDIPAEGKLDLPGFIEPQPLRSAG